MNSKNKIKKTFKLIDTVYYQNNPGEKNILPKRGKGREKTYTDFTIFKIYLLMNLLNIKTIKNIWQILDSDHDLRHACGLTHKIDRTTLNRRLNQKYKKL